MSILRDLQSDASHSDGNMNVCTKLPIVDETFPLKTSNVNHMVLLEEKSQGITRSCRINPLGSMNFFTNVPIFSNLNSGLLVALQGKLWLS